ncbi:urease accessory protein UreD [Rhabdaerophilum sp. SD176]|uniref:urease accessory protein UreD n=1 Tax=Rhabdaerophilum sp. SD176 TaxID=2983548 RepID=UPI0024DFA158|nr:urease accessory protein UreD [Rhabdaerophilum sp. SD176]
MMSGNALRSDGDALRLPPAVRVEARLRLGLAHLDGQSRLTERHEAGAFRFRFPRAHGRSPEAVLVNVAGGLAGGDSVSIDLRLGPGAELTLSSATAERIYRSDGSATRLSNRLDIGPDARMLWLPQETILFEQAALERHFEIDLAATGQLVLGEMLYFGRVASGETFTRGAIRDRWRLRRAGRLALAEDLRLDLAGGGALRDPVALGEHVALGTLLLALPDPQDLLEAIRGNVAEEPGLEIGTTLVDGLVLLRAAGKDAALLRRQLLRVARFVLGRIGMPYPRAFTNE